MERKGRVGLLVGVALVLVALLALTGVTQASPDTGEGAVCPAGNVKYEIGSGYEYNNGSATITGDANQVCWSATAGYEITSVCIKIGGPGGGELIDGGSGNGCGGPYAYGISHVVVTTDEVQEPTPTTPPQEPTPTLPPGEPTPTTPPQEPTPTTPVWEPTPTSPPWEPTPPAWPLCWPRIEVGVTGCVPSGGSISQWFEGRKISDRTWKGETLLIDADYSTTYEFRWWSPSTGLTIGYVTTYKEVKGRITCPIIPLTYPFPCVGEPTPVPPPPELPKTGVAQLLNPWFISAGMLGVLAIGGAVATRILRKRR